MRPVVLRAPLDRLALALCPHGRSRKIPPTLDRNRAEHPEPVGERVEVAHAVQPVPLEAGHLSHPQTRLGDPDVDERLDLESVAPQPPLLVAVE
jgi:hypothetical protein